LLPDPSVVALTYYYNSVEFFSSAKRVLLPLKIIKITTENVLLFYFFRNFAPNFISSSVVFVDGVWGAQECFLL